MDLSREEKEHALELLKEKEERNRYNYIKTIFPDQGELLEGCLKDTSRSNYPKHIDFIKSGSTHTERAFIAGNRCLPINQLVRMADGTQKVIQEVKTGDKVLAFDIKTKNLVEALVIDTYKGKDNCFSYDTRIGKINCTEDHEFLVRSKRGVIKRKKIKDCNSGDKLLIPTKWDKPSTVKYLSKDVCFLIGILVGDGYLSARDDQFKLTNNSLELINKVKDIYEKELKGRGRISKREEDNFYDLFFPKTMIGRGKSPLYNLLEPLGLIGTHSHTKFIPKDILDSSEECIRQFLHGLFAADAHSRKGRVTYYTSSKELAEDVKIACLRLGITTTCSVKQHNNPKHRDSYQVEIVGNRNLNKLGNIPTKPIKLWSGERESNEDRGYSIMGVTPLGYQDVFCITVDHPDHLFISDGFISANCGKSLTGLYELVTHCIGVYPDWWPGKRFNRPVQCWLVGDRGDVIRDGMQRLLMGRDGRGTGLIPKDCLIRETALQGTPNGIGMYYIKHIPTGRESVIVVKTYQAGKDAFESAEVDVAMLDEECPMPIYTEVQMRVLTTGGTVYLTFTPDNGLTDTVIHFLDKPKLGDPEKFVVCVGWSDVPHLSEERKTQLLATIPPHMRDVKTKGIPYLGSGAIYPIPEDDIKCEPFKIPHYWPRAYAVDPSWNRTAVVWGAYNEREDIWYVYSVYVRGQTELPIHVDAVKSRGDWIKGVIDPYALGGGRGKDGEAFFEAYLKAGLDLMIANNAVEAGIQEVYQRLSTGKIKIFSNLSDWFQEYRIYRRDDKGRIVKKNDDLMDATRYLVMSGEDVMDVAPQEEDEDSTPVRRYNSGANPVTGY